MLGQNIGTGLNLGRRQGRTPLSLPRQPQEILDHINTKLRTVGHNNITRCQSCAEGGHDRSGDNLSISIEDPRKYIWWAGCTRDMIRAAVSCPRPVQWGKNKIETSLAYFVSQSTDSSVNSQSWRFWMQPPRWQTVAI